MRLVPTILILALLPVVPGCGSSASPDPRRTPDPLVGQEVDDGSASGYEDIGYDITFLDDCPTNTSLDEGLGELVFVERTGRETKVADFAEGRHIVLVMTRGNTTPICPYCSTQTADYIRNYEAFTRRGAEVLLAYPVELERHRGKLRPFLDDARSRLDDPNRPIPFPILFDVELRAVNKLGIRKDLSKPATYIIDNLGRVRYAYVGGTIADRPSVRAIITELDKLGPVPSNSPADPADEALRTGPDKGKSQPLEDVVPAGDRTAPGVEQSASRLSERNGLSTTVP